MSSDPAELDLSSVAVFPLPGVVLLPRAVLPLHIFEDRYREMMVDVLAGDRVIAMALLREGWQKNYYGRAEIEPVVCVGRILSHEKLADGRYNLLLQGEVRATVVEESTGKPYRVARLEALAELPAMDIDLEEQRRRLGELFERPPLGASGAGKQFRQIVRSHLSTSDVADLAAFTFLDCFETKQSLLADADVRSRVTRTVAALEEWAGRAEMPMDFPSPADPSVN